MEKVGIDLCTNIFTNKEFYIALFEVILLNALILLPSSNTTPTVTENIALSDVFF